MTRSIRTMPEAQKRALHRARWLEAIWLAVLASIVAAVYFAVGSSQAMKTAWIEDLLSFVPPLAFLVGSWLEGGNRTAASRWGISVSPQLLI